MKRTLTAALAVSAATLALGTAGALAQDCPIRIGGMAPLSAPGSVVGGEAMRDAMLIAQDDINAKGGVLGCDVEVVIGDTEGLPEKGKALMEKFITQDKVAGVGGAYHSSVGVASKDVANEHGVPVVFAETWNDTITGDKQKYIFRIAPLSSWASNTFWQFASLAPDVKNVAIITENTDYGIPAAQETEKGLKEKGIDSQTFSVDIGTQDFSGIIQRIKARDPDFIIVLNTGEAAFNFTQQAADAGIGPQDVPMITGQDALESEAYWRNVPDGAMAFVQLVGLPESQYNDEAKAFAEKYRQKTGKTGVESYALEAYDSIKVLADAIAIAGSTDGDAIVEALESNHFQGTLGDIYFPYGTKKDPGADGKGDENWHQWPDVALIMLQYTEEGQTKNDAAIVWPDAYKTADPVWVSE